MTTVKKILMIMALGPYVLLYQNCTPFEKAQLGASSSEVSFFVGLYDKILEPKCLDCHSGVTAAGGKDFSSHALIVSSGTVTIGNASTSSIYLSVLNPAIEAHASLSSQELQGLSSWIDNGARENETPEVFAGNDISVRLPSSTATIEGRAKDIDGQIVSYLWDQTQGPNSAILNNAATRTLNLSNLIEGSYTFRLTATDNFGTSATDTVSVNVSLSPNNSPVVSAGADRALTLPTSSITITATASDSDGTISSIMWTQTSGPNTATFSGQTTFSLIASNLIVGTYVFNIEVTDNRGASRSDAMNVVVSPEGANQLPLVNAGADRAITLPTSMISISATASDPDGSITAFLWTQVSGPNTATLSGATTVNLTASNLVAGTYVYNIRVTDNRGGVANDTISILVNPAPTVPTFTQLNSEIFVPQCVGCHGSNNPRGGYNMTSYTNIRTRVVVNNASGSTLHREVNNNSMPPGAPLSTINKNRIRDWINAGALNN